MDEFARVSQEIFNKNLAEKEAIVDAVELLHLGAEERITVEQGIGLALDKYQKDLISLDHIKLSSIKKAAQSIERMAKGSIDEMHKLTTFGENDTAYTHVPEWLDPLYETVTKYYADIRSLTDELLQDLPEKTRNLEKSMVRDNLLRDLAKIFKKYSQELVIALPYTEHDPTDEACLEPKKIPLFQQFAFKVFEVSEEDARNLLHEIYRWTNGLKKSERL